MNQILLGLDFGTCYSSAALNINNVPKPIKEPINRGYSFPSSVFITAQEQILIGQAAENSRQKDPQRYRREFKRDLGSPNPYTVGNTARLPEELATEVIRKLKIEAEKVAQGLGENLLTNAVLTIPATYQPFKRQLMEQAGREAGFNQIELLEEPVAAAYYYSRQAEVAEGEIVLVYDLGGGTFDATLIQKQGSGYQILGMPRGLSHCGGTDFDRQIYQGLRNKCSPQLQEKLSARDGWLARAIVTESCRDLKHQLSQQPEATIYIPLELNSVESYSLSRVEFNQTIAPLIGETIDCCDQLVRSANIDWQQIDRILLVGGSCRIPYIQQVISQKFQRQALLVDEPELAVCIGAAIKRVTEVKPPRVVVTTPPSQSEKTEAAEVATNTKTKLISITAAELYQQASQLLIQTPNDPQAIGLLSQALEIDSGYAEALFARGEIRAALGDQKDAETDLYQAAQIYFARQNFTRCQEIFDKIQAIHRLDSPPIPEPDLPPPPTAFAENLKNYLTQKKQSLNAKNYTWQEKVTIADLPLEAIAKGKQKILISFDAYFMFAVFSNLDLATLRYFALESLEYCQNLRTKIAFGGTICYAVAVVEAADANLISALRHEPLHREEGMTHGDYVLPAIYSLNNDTLYLSEKKPFFDPIGWTSIKKNARQILS